MLHRSNAQIRPSPNLSETRKICTHERNERLHTGCVRLFHDGQRQRWITDIDEELGIISSISSSHDQIPHVLVISHGSTPATGRHRRTTSAATSTAHSRLEWRWAENKEYLGTVTLEKSIACTYILWREAGPVSATPKSLAMDSGNPDQFI